MSEPPPGITGVTVILAEPDDTRLRAAMALACACAALGGRARLHFHEHAVALLIAGPEPNGGDKLAEGLPDRTTLFAHAREAGVELTACQTGMSLQRIEHAQLPTDTEPSSLVGLLATIGDDRLVMA